VRQRKKAVQIGSQNENKSGGAKQRERRRRESGGEEVLTDSPFRTERREKEQQLIS